MKESNTLLRRSIGQFTNNKIVEVYFIKKVNSYVEWYYTGEENNSPWTSFTWKKYAKEFDYPPITELQEIMEDEHSNGYMDIYKIESYFKLKTDEY